MPQFISSVIARRKANGLMLDQVSDLLLAGESDLIRREDGRLVWRVSIDLTLASQGRVGRVGTLDIDAQSGQVIYTDELLHQITRAAERLVNEQQKE